MPHDKQNRLIEVGDVIKTEALNLKRVVVGPVQNIHSEGQICTGQVLCPVIGGMVPDYFNAKDAEIILKKDGSEPSAPDPDITASEAVFAFTAWLTMNIQPVTFGAKHDAAVAAQLADHWCKHNKLPPPREKVYPNNIRQPMYAVGG